MPSLKTLTSRAWLPSLRWQLVGIVFVVLLASLLFYAWIADNLLLTTIDRQLTDRLELAGLMLEYDVPWKRMAGYLPGDQATEIFQQDMEGLRHWAGRQGLSRITLLSGDGKVRFDTAGLEPGALAGVALPSTNAGRLAPSMLYRDREGWQKFADLRLGDGRLARLTAGKEMLGAVDRLRSRRLLAFGLGLAIAGLLSWGLTFQLSLRLRRLTRGFHDLQAGQRGIRVQLTGNDEIAYLAASFNTMAAEIESRAEKEKREQERRLEELKILAAGVAHEIRNPLAAIAGLSDLLARDPAVAGSEETLDLSRRIQREIGRLDRIVTDVLAYARQPKLNLTWETPLSLLQEAAAHDPRCRLEHPNGLGTQVWVDRAGWLSVLRNLVQNAREATGPDGRVRLGVRFRPDRTLFYVADDGPGVRAADAEAIFQPFFSKKSKGTGLGLAISRNIVEAHGGQLRLANATQGAVFVAFLPVQTPPATEVPEKRPGV